MYRVVPDAATLEQVAALPVEALSAYAEVLAVLDAAVDGRPQHEDNPGAAVRYWSFGPERADQVVYLILEEQREVHLLPAQWLGLLRRYATGDDGLLRLPPCPGRAGLFGGVSCSIRVFVRGRCHGRNRVRSQEGHVPRLQVWHP